MRIGACGLAVELARPGLIACPEVFLALAGLRLLLNPTDSIASAQLTFLHNATEMELESWLLPRLEEVARYDLARATGEPLNGYISWGDDPALKRVLDRQRDYGSLSPLEILHQAMDLTGVRDQCVDWGEPSRRLANLEKLASFTDDYQKLVQARGEASSITGLLTHLYRMANDSEDEQAMGGADAVESPPITEPRVSNGTWLFSTSSTRSQRTGFSSPRSKAAWRFPLKSRWKVAGSAIGHGLTPTTGKVLSWTGRSEHPGVCRGAEASRKRGDQTAVCWNDPSPRLSCFCRAGRLSQVARSAQRQERRIRLLSCLRMKQPRFKGFVLSG